MPDALVTGVAGFIGSRLAEQLLASGWRVRGLDALTPYYDEATKRTNLDEIRSSGALDLLVADIVDVDLGELLSGVDVVFHLAAEPGVRPSWDHFERYVRHNVTATQVLLDAVRRAGPVRLVAASSSSVYGQVTGPVDETAPTVPFSPYGVTKLAGELLIRAYAENFELDAVCLRLFTVYGPRQRPDMAMRRLIDAALGGAAFPLYGDGSQVRAFTYVDDVVDAFIAAANADVAPGSVYNVSGGTTCRLLDVIDTLGELCSREIPLDRRPPTAGDVGRTDGVIERATRELGWRPHVALRDGLKRQLAAAVARSGLRPSARP